MFACFVSTCDLFRRCASRYVHATVVAGAEGYERCASSTQHAARSAQHSSDPLLSHHPLTGSIAGPDLLIADGMNHVVRKYHASSRTVSTLIGTPGVVGATNHATDPRAATLHYPTGLVVDVKRNSIFIADRVRHAVLLRLLLRLLHARARALVPAISAALVKRITSEWCLRLRQRPVVGARGRAPPCQSVTQSICHRPHRLTIVSERWQRWVRVLSPRRPGCVESGAIEMEQQTVHSSAAPFQWP